MTRPSFVVIAGVVTPVAILLFSHRDGDPPTTNPAGASPRPTVLRKMFVAPVGAVINRPKIPSPGERVPRRGGCGMACKNYRSAARRAIRESPV